MARYFLTALRGKGFVIVPELSLGDPRSIAKKIDVIIALMKRRNRRSK